MFLKINKDELFISEGGNDRVSVFGLDGKFRRNIGSRGGVEAGTFMRITGLTIDEEGRLYVGDRMTNNIQVFEPGGAFYALLSNETASAGLKTNPVGLAVRNKKIAVAVPLAQKVQLYDLQAPMEILQERKK